MAYFNLKTKCWRTRSMIHMNRKRAISSKQRELGSIQRRPPNRLHYYSMPLWGDKFCCSHADRPLSPSLCLFLATPGMHTIISRELLQSLFGVHSASCLIIVLILLKKQKHGSPWSHFEEPTSRIHNGICLNCESGARHGAYSGPIRTVCDLSNTFLDCFVFGEGHLEGATYKIQRVPM